MRDLSTRLWKLWKTGPLHRVPVFCVKGPETALGDEAAAEADGYRVRSAAGLELGQQMADVRLDRLLGEEEPLPDLAVHEAVRDQLEDLDLAHGRLLLELAERRAERDHLGR